jgi:hypothetical protein
MGKQSRGCSKKKKKMEGAVLGRESRNTGLINLVNNSRRIRGRKSAEENILT